jgi:hypothetical protein
MEPRGHGAHPEAVRIGCSPLLPLPRLQAFLGALLLELPEVVPRVAHLRTAEQERRLHQGELELGLVEAVVGDDPGTELLFPGDPLDTVLPFYHPLGREPVVVADDLAGETLLLFPRRVDPALHDWYRTLIERNALPFAHVRETGDADPRDVLLAVAEGRGVTLAPQPSPATAGDYGAAVITRDLRPLTRYPATLLAWPRRDPTLPPATIAAVRRAVHHLRSS